MYLYTPERFLEIALEAELAGMSTSNPKERSDAYTLQRKAEAAMRIMEKLGLEQVTQLGSFGERKLARGTMVRIKKGTVIQTTHPKFNRYNPKVAGRDYVVKLHDTYNGHIDHHFHDHKAHEAFRNETVLWAGTGGYWCEVDSSLVEVVEV